MLRTPDFFFLGYVISPGCKSTGPWMGHGYHTSVSRLDPRGQDCDGTETRGGPAWRQGQKGATGAVCGFYLKVSIDSLPIPKGRLDWGDHIDKPVCGDG